jgi:hypothetical protein
LRRFLPDSLAAWALLIVIGGLVIAEVATVGVILQSRALSARMGVFFHLAERVSSVSRAIASEPPAPAPATTRSPSWRTFCRRASAIRASPRSMSGAVP